MEAQVFDPQWISDRRTERGGKQARNVHRTRTFIVRATAKKVDNLFLRQQLRGISRCTIHYGPSFTTSFPTGCFSSGRSGCRIVLGLALWAQIIQALKTFHSKTTGGREGVSSGLLCHVCHRTTHYIQAITINRTILVDAGTTFPPIWYLFTSDAS